MSRLIELQQVNACRQRLTIRVGDVLLVSGSDGRVASGSSIELGGPYLPATAVASGEILTAAGTPHTMLAWARSPGPASLEIVNSEAWQHTEKTMLRVDVEE